MTTGEARNTSLSLLVAFPGPGADGVEPLAQRCGPMCSAAGSGGDTLANTSAGTRSACGHMYWDGGEEVETGNALDNYIVFSAQLTALVQFLVYF